MKLTYRDTPAEGPHPPAVVLHREGMAAMDDLGKVAAASGAVGRVVAPFGDYAYTANGMEVAGICWYRILPGFAGTDPISLAKAVVQVGDLLDDLHLDRPALIGWGQGAVVALGAGLLRGKQVGSVVCVDPSLADVELLPAAALASDAAPRLLLAAADANDGPDLGQLHDFLGRRSIDVVTWRWSGQGGNEDRNRALARRIGEWLGDG